MKKGRNEESLRLRQLIKYRIERSIRKKKPRLGDYPRVELPFLHSISRREEWAMKLKEKLTNYYY